MLLDIYKKISNKVNEKAVAYTLDHINKNDLVSYTKREPRERDAKTIKNEMVFEVDEKRLEELQKELDKVKNLEWTGYEYVDIKKYPLDQYPEKWI